MKKTEFTLLKDLLAKAVNQHGLKRQVDGGLVCHRFRKLAEALWHDGVAECVRPASFKDGVLMVKVADSGWAQQLYFKKVTILKQLNEAEGGSEVKDIRIRVGMASS